MKTCTKCDTSKDLALFSRQSKGKFGVTSICKVCSSTRGKLWAKANAERHRANHDAWMENNKAKATATRKAWGVLNAEKERLRLQKWAQDNKMAAAAKVAARRAAKLRATPAWADLAQIALIYRWSKHCEQATGIKSHVDHIVPLVSAVVCGLHCPANLIARTASSNRSKGNKWDVNRTFYP